MVNSKNERYSRIIQNVNSLLEKLNETVLDSKYYSYETTKKTLVEKNSFYKKELKKLDSIKDNEDTLNKAIDKLQTILLLVQNNNYKHIKYFNEIELPIYIPTLNDEINLFYKEYTETLNICKRGFFTTLKGIKGENNLEKELNLYRDRIKTLPNIRLEVEDTTVESDFIVISKNGLFCIEVKNYGHSGEKLIVSKDGKWTKLDKGGIEQDISNITSQLYRHIGISQRYLNESLEFVYGSGAPYIELNPIIVIGNDKVTIENNSDIPVLRISNVFHYINTYKGNIKLSIKDFDVIEETLHRLNKGQKPYDVELRVDKIVNAFNIILNKIKTIFSIDKTLNIEKNLYPLLVKSNILARDLSTISVDNFKNSRKINSDELMSLLSLLEKLRMKTWENLNTYKLIIKHYFNISSLSDLTYDEYTKICSIIRTHV